MDEQLDRIEKKLDHLLDHLHLLGSFENDLPPPQTLDVRQGNHKLIPSDDELRKRAAARPVARTT